MTERENALHNIMMLGFAIVETGMYLDGHVDDSEALAYYNDKNEALESAVEHYEKKYGPLTIYGGTANEDKWLWATAPWPWEV